MPWLETDDRTQLFYVDGGSGSPIVFVPAAWLSSRMWEFQLAHFAARGYRAIAYDRRGHGRSDWPWTGYDCDTLAEDLATLLESLDLRDVTLVGHSMGSCEIVRYLTGHGAGRVARIALVGATVPFPMKTEDNPEGIDPHFIEADLAARTADRPKWFAENADGFFGVGLPGVSISPEFVQFMIGQCLDCSPHAAVEVFRAGVTTDFRRELERISVPTLIVHGTHDVQAPIDVCGRRTARLVRDSVFLEYENAAHGLFVTHAPRLNDDLMEFMEGRLAQSRAQGA